MSVAPLGNTVAWRPRTWCVISRRPPLCEPVSFSARPRSKCVPLLPSLSIRARLHRPCAMSPYLCLLLHRSRIASPSDRSVRRSRRTVAPVGGAARERHPLPQPVRHWFLFIPALTSALPVRRGHRRGAATVPGALPGASRLPFPATGRRCLSNSLI